MIGVKPCLDSSHPTKEYFSERKHILIIVISNRIDHKNEKLSNPFVLGCPRFSMKYVTFHYPFLYSFKIVFYRLYKNNKT